MKNQKQNNQRHNDMPKLLERHVGVWAGGQWKSEGDNRLNALNVRDCFLY